MKDKKEFWRMIKFTLFSISAGVIQGVSFTLLTELTAMDYEYRYLISLVLSVLWNFTLNRKYTFKSAANIPLAMVKVAIYYAVFTPLTTLLGQYLVGTLHWNDYLVQGLNMALNFVTEFLFQRYVVFGRSLDTAKPSKTDEVLMKLVDRFRKKQPEDSQQEQ